MFVHNYTIVWPKVYTGIYYKSAAVIKFIIAWTFAQPVLNIWFVKLGLWKRAQLTVKIMIFLRIMTANKLFHIMNHHEFLKLYLLSTLNINCLKTLLSSLFTRAFL
jgi:hypothetical protein